MNPPNGDIRVAPSVLAADFGQLAQQIAEVESAGAQLLHLDVMDGHFVPNLSFGVPVVRSIRECTGLLLDTHLMIEEPLRYAPAFVEAGADLITFHVEVVDHPRQVVNEIRSLGVRVGVALNPDTPAEAILEIIEQVDLVLVMSVWPGFGGQAFMPEALPKIETTSPPSFTIISGWKSMAAWASTTSLRWSRPAPTRSWPVVRSFPRTPEPA